MDRYQDYLEAISSLTERIRRVLCVLMFCCSLVFVSCAEEPFGEEEKTENRGVVPISIEVEEVTSTTVKFSMTLDADGMADYQEAGLIFSPVDDIDMSSEEITTFQLNRESYSKVFDRLKYNTTYYYTYYLKKNGLYKYGQTQTFSTSDITVDLTLDKTKSTATNARINGVVNGLSDADKSLIEVGMYYSSEEGKVEKGEGMKLTAADISTENSVAFDISELTFGTTYYYCPYVKQGDSYVYGEVKTFITGAVTVRLSAGSITATTAHITGTIYGLSDADKSLIEVGMYYSSEEGKVEKGEGMKLTAADISTENSVAFDISELTFGTTYYYCPYVKQGDSYVYGEVKTFIAGAVTVRLSAGSITATTAHITGTICGLSNTDKSLIEVGMYYSSEEGKVEKGEGMKLTAADISTENSVAFDISELTFGTTYYYCPYVKQGDSYVYGEVKTFVTESVLLKLSVVSVTATTAQVTGNVEGLSESDKSLIEVGILWSTARDFVEERRGVKMPASEISSKNSVSFAISKLVFGTTHYYCSYVKQGDSCAYGEVKTFVTDNVSLNLSIASTTSTSVQMTGIVKGLSEADKSLIEVGILYSSDEDMVELGSGTYYEVTPSQISSGNNVTFTISNLVFDTTYYYCQYVIIQGRTQYVYGEVNSFKTKCPVAPFGYTNLSAEGTANCYIISQSGRYCILAAKGNKSSEYLYSMKSVGIIWKTFGNSNTPLDDSLIKSVAYKDGYITFQTTETFEKGNALIAAGDANGNLLWSWHIWLTDEPQEQVYYNNAGTMMDRNLGATSATPGDVRSLGLLYQWGRKDPFMGASSISSGTIAKKLSASTYSVVSGPNCGTIEYAIAHPTAFILFDSLDSHYSMRNYDWYYTGSKATDNTRWTESSSTKSIYDPCPAGWRVPDGGSNGVWAKALGSSDILYSSELFDDTKKGINFSGKFGDDYSIWYPAAGCFEGLNETFSWKLTDVGITGLYWSASPSPSSYLAEDLYFSGSSIIHSRHRRVDGLPVRCIKDSKY